MTNSEYASKYYYSIKQTLDICDISSTTLYAKCVEYKIVQKTQKGAHFI